jgi:hypothetical protein
MNVKKYSTGNTHRGIAFDEDLPDDCKLPKVDGKMVVPSFPILLLILLRIDEDRLITGVAWSNKDENELFTE